MLFMLKSPTASSWTITAHKVVNHFLHKLRIIKPKITFEPISRYLCTKSPNVSISTNICTYCYIKPYLRKLGIMTPKATFERNPCYLCRKTQLHPFELLLHIWLLNHFLHKLHIIKPKNHIWGRFMLFMHKKPKCINFNNYCTYAY